MKRTAVFLTALFLGMTLSAPLAAQEEGASPSERESRTTRASSRQEAPAARERPNVRAPQQSSAPSSSRSEVRSEPARPEPSPAASSAVRTAPEPRGSSLWPDPQIRSGNTTVNRPGVIQRNNPEPAQTPAHLAPVDMPRVLPGQPQHVVEPQPAERPAPVRMVPEVRGRSVLPPRTDNQPERLLPQPQPAQSEPARSEPRRSVIQAPGSGNPQTENRQPQPAAVNPLPVRGNTGAPSVLPGRSETRVTPVPDLRNSLPSRENQVSLARELRNVRAPQPADIKLPDEVPTYQSGRPTQSYNDWDRYWRDSQRYSNPKRHLWQQYTRRPQPVHIIRETRYVPYPVYYYQPSRGFHYWGWDDCRWDYSRGINIVYVYTRPASASFNYVSVPSYTYTSTAGRYASNYPADNTLPYWDGYETEKREIERVAQDIGRAWERSDSVALERFVDREVPIRLYESGNYRYWMSEREFLAMARESMRVEGTQYYKVDRVLPVRPGEVLFYARRELRSSGRADNTQYERYTLERLGDRWVISAYETSPFKMLE